MAVRSYKKAARLNPDAIIYRYIAEAYYDGLYHKKTLKYISKSLQINPNNDTSLYLSAKAHYLNSNYEQAFADINKVIEKNKTYADYYFVRGSFYYKLGDYYNLGDFPSALSDVNRSIMFEDDYTPAYILRAKILFALKDYDMAIADLNAIISVNSIYNAEAYYERGITKWAMEDTNGACEDWLSSFEHGNKNAEKKLYENCE